MFRLYILYILYILNNHLSLYRLYNNLYGSMEIGRTFRSLLLHRKVMFRNVVGYPTSPLPWLHQMHHRQQRRESLAVYPGRIQKYEHGYTSVLTADCRHGIGNPIGQDLLHLYSIGIDHQLALIGKDVIHLCTSAGNNALKRD